MKNHRKHKKNIAKSWETHQKFTGKKTLDSHRKMRNTMRKHHCEKGLPLGNHRETIGKSLKAIGKPLKNNCKTTPKPFEKHSKTIRNKYQKPCEKHEKTISKALKTIENLLKNEREVKGRPRNVNAGQRKAM